MIDHIGISVSDYEASKLFYQAVLEPLGFSLLMEIEGWAGFGADKPELWIAKNKALTPPVHIAFSSDQRSKVDTFYSKAIKAGATDNGAPGIRKIYHPNYYAAFVLDLDGNNIEAVCHSPE